MSVEDLRIALSAANPELFGQGPGGSRAGELTSDQNLILSRLQEYDGTGASLASSSAYDVSEYLEGFANYMSASVEIVQPNQDIEITQRDGAYFINTGGAELRFDNEERAKAVLDRMQGGFVVEGPGSESIVSNQEGANRAAGNIQQFNAQLVQDIGAFSAEYVAQKAPTQEDLRDVRFEASMERADNAAQMLNRMEVPGVQAEMSPDGRTDAFTISPQDFAQYVSQHASLSFAIVGQDMFGDRLEQNEVREMLPEIVADLGIEFNDAGNLVIDREAVARLSDARTANGASAGNPKDVAVAGVVLEAVNELQRGAFREVRQEHLATAAGFENQTIHSEYLQGHGYSPSNGMDARAYETAQEVVDGVLRGSRPMLRTNALNMDNGTNLEQMHDYREDRFDGESFGNLSRQEQLEVMLDTNTTQMVLLRENIRGYMEDNNITPEYLEQSVTINGQTLTLQDVVQDYGSYSHEERTTVLRAFEDTHGISAGAIGWTQEEWGKTIEIPGREDPITLYQAHQAFGGLSEEMQEFVQNEFQRVHGEGLVPGSKSEIIDMVREMGGNGLRQLHMERAVMIESLANEGVVIQPDVLETPFDVPMDQPLPSEPEPVTMTAGAAQSEVGRLAMQAMIQSIREPGRADEIREILREEIDQIREANPNANIPVDIHSDAGEQYIQEAATTAAHAALSNAPDNVARGWDTETKLAITEVLQGAVDRGYDGSGADIEAAAATEEMLAGKLGLQSVLKLEEKAMEALEAGNAALATNMILALPEGNQERFLNALNGAAAGGLPEHMSDIEGHVGQPVADQVNANLGAIYNVIDMQEIQVRGDAADVDPTTVITADVHSAGAGSLDR